MSIRAFTFFLIFIAAMLHMSMQAATGESGEALPSPPSSPSKVDQMPISAQHKQALNKHDKPDQSFRQARLNSREKYNKLTGRVAAANKMKIETRKRKARFGAASKSSSRGRH